MLLDRIDIDAHGPLNTVELGPFSEHLNVVCGPEGSGKTAIVRFVRDSLVDRDYPLGMMSSSSGRIVWADRNGIVHCRREKDGTAKGRRTIEVESRGNLSPYTDSIGSEYHSGPATDWVNQYTGNGHYQEAAQRSIQLPESIVDGVITDTAVTSVQRVVSACIRSGLDSPETYRDLALSANQYRDDSAAVYSAGYDANHGYEHGRYEDHRELRSELANVESELSRLGSVNHVSSGHVSSGHVSSGHNSSERESLIRRREELVALLSRRTHVAPNNIAYDRGFDSSYASQQLASLHGRTHELRFRRSELARWIESIDRQIADYHQGRRPYTTDAYRSGTYVAQPHGYHDDQLRRQLSDLDAQMIKWRHALLEVRGVRESIAASAGSFDSSRYASMDFQDIHRARYNGFLDAADHYDVRHPWDASAWYRHDDRPYQHIDEIDARFDSALRHVDELLSRYTAADHVGTHWYHAADPVSPHAASSVTGDQSLCDMLRSIRHDLQSMSVAMPSHRRDPVAMTSSAPGHWYQSISARHDDLLASERWLAASIEGINRHRDELLRRYSAAQNVTGTQVDYRTGTDMAALHAERDARVIELQNVSASLDSTLREAFELRRSMRHLPVLGNSLYRSGNTYPNGHTFSPAWSDHHAIRSEISSIDQRLSSWSRIGWLQNRRNEIRRQLQTVRRPVATVSPLSDLASTWLVRLSGGRLTRVSWGLDGRVVTMTSGDGGSREESHCSGADRAISVLAVRMAAGELLHRIGRPVPLVLETHRELLGQTRRAPVDVIDQNHYVEQGDLGRYNHPIAAALRDYAQNGRQVVMLTSDRELADQLGRVGARQYEVLTHRTQHAHRPIWRPHYSPEQYVGPHPHTYGRQSADGIDDINRDFDMAWREAYGFYDNHSHSGVAPAVRTDLASDGTAYRDGFYYSHSYTTEPNAVDQNRSAQPSSFNGTHSQMEGGSFREEPSFHCESATAASQAVPSRAVSKRTLTRAASQSPASPSSASPFFLTVDSPIDQAPSIDAVAAARLRGLSITHVTHLMQQDSNRLSDSLGLADVDARTIRRWQAECRLACRVPHLRGFDARVLVGCGIQTPSELASIHPVELLQRVESFLATDRGQQLLLSGSSHELSRLTTWIATANSTHGDYSFDSDRYEYDRDGRRILRSGDRDRGQRNRRRVSETQEADVLNGRTARSSRSRNRAGRHRERDPRETSRYGIRSAADDSRDRDGVIDGYVADRDYVRRSRSSRANGSGSGNGFGSGLGSGNGTGTGNGSGSGSGSGRSRRSSRSSSRSNRGDRGYVSYGDREYTAREPRDRDRTDRERLDREPREKREYVRSEREERAPRERRETENSERELRFYLQRDSPVVDAPSIGSRMAARLEAIGIHTVNDLLTADPETAAAELDHRRIDAETFLQWQQQATLVCRVPMLRGHDAQLLVAAEITSAEELAVQEANELFSLIDPIARGSEGKRIIRGGKLPDMEEITEWIDYSQHQRALQAA